jgi:transposase
MKCLHAIELGMGLTPPWEVVSYVFDRENNRYDVEVDFVRGSTFPCSECGKECKVYDTDRHSWRAMDNFGHPVIVNARQPRTNCSDCGIRVAEVPWSRQGSRFTYGFENYILQQAGSMPVSAIAELVGEHDTRLWRIIQHYIDSLFPGVDFSRLRRIGIDDKAATQRGHNYISVFVDLDTSTPIFIAEGRDASTIGRFVEALKKNGGDPAAIEQVSCDMSPAYISGVKKHLPQAEITFDKFHIIGGLNDAVDQIRRQERKECPDLKNTRYIWLKNPEELTDKEQKVLEKIREDHPHLKTIEAYDLRLEFQKLWDQPDHKAERFLKKWCDRAAETGSKQIKTFVGTVKEHWKGILNWFRSHITNAVLEGINSLISVAQFRARGFRTTRYLAAIIYLAAGGIDFELPIQNSE